MANGIELQTIYDHRFRARLEYRRRVWSVLCRDFWSRFVPANADVLDLGSGYGEFINQIRARRKFAMDLNPSAKQHLDKSIIFLEQDCSVRWQLADASLDVVFSSNLFEHLPDKATLARTFAEAHRCLRKEGLLIAVGPNIRYVRKEYWDFWDHYLPLSDRSLAEGLRASGFTIQEQIARFLPYTMSTGPVFPLWLVSTYIRLPILWKRFGKQFAIIARKADPPPPAKFDVSVNN